MKQEPTADTWRAKRTSRMTATAWLYGVARAYENAVVEGNAALRGLVAAKGNAVIGGDIIVSGTGDIDGNISITGSRPIHLNGEILAGEGTLTLNKKHY